MFALNLTPGSRLCHRTAKALDVHTLARGARRAKINSSSVYSQFIIHNLLFIIYYS